MKRVIRCSKDNSDYIDYLQTKIRILEHDLERDEYRDDQERLDDYEALEELRQELNFAWQDDEAEYNYAVQQQEFNPDGSLKFYGSEEVYCDNDVLTDEEKETLREADTSEWSKMMSDRLEDDINKAGGYSNYIKRERVYSSLASSSDKVIQNQIRQCLSKIKDSNLQFAILDVLFDSENTINWKKAYTAFQGLIDKAEDKK